jgi:arylsulfatase A-like enzyme
VFPWVGKPGYNLTTDMADDAVKYMSDLNAVAPDKPFFVYYVPGGTHSPHQPTKEWIDKFKGKFDMGYEKLREEIFANQKRLGVIPANTQLTPWPDGQATYGGAKLPRWDSLSLIQKKLYSREAEVFAAYAAYTDHEIGRVIQEVQDEGKLDNTLIIYISGDNGTSAEGTLEGTYNQMTAYNGILTLPEALQMLGTMKTGARIRPTRICRWHGRGRSIPPSSGPSRWRRISAAPGKVWPFHGLVTSPMLAASARNSTMLSTSCRRSLKRRVSRRLRWSTALSRSRSKA